MRVFIRIVETFYLFIIFTLAIYTVGGNPSWWQNANADANFPSGNGYIGYGSNYPANGVWNYSRCDIENSDFTPVAADFYNLNTPQIVLSQGTTIKIYGMNCEFLNAFSLGNSIIAMPVIMNFDSDDRSEIWILTNLTLESWEYVNYNWTRTHSIIHNARNLKGLSCTTRLYPSLASSCLSFMATSRNVTIFDITHGTISSQNNRLSANYQYVDGFVGFSNANEILKPNWFQYTGQRWITPVCGLAGTTGSKCDILDEAGSLIRTITDTQYYLGTGPNAIEEEAFIAKLGSTARIFKTEKTSNRGLSETIFSLDGDVLFRRESAFNNQDHYSNWMVADFNKDGFNDACIIYVGGRDGLRGTNITCVDSSLSIILNAVITKSFNLSQIETKGFVMGDFNHSNPTLGFATVSGIYYLFGENFTQIFNSSYAHSASRNGNLIIVSGSTDDNPAAVYTDSTIGFIIRNSYSSITCGNGICEIGENALVCNDDCSTNASGARNATGMTCIHNSDCQTGLCEYNICVKKGTNALCTTNSECMSGVCNFGKCTKPSLWVSIDTSKDELAGDDTSTNNLISITIMIVSMVAISIAVHAFWGIFAFMAEAIFFTLVGWLSTFILFGIFFVGLVTIIIIFMTGGEKD